MKLRAHIYQTFCRIFRWEIIRDSFQGVLGRDPEEKALRAYEGSFRGLGVMGVIRDLTNSGEAWEQQKGAHTEELIREAYEGVLDREPEAEETRSFEGKFEVMKLKGVISALIESLEHREAVKREYSEENIQDIYRSLLEREADKLGLKKNSAYLKNNGLKKTLEVFKNSAEFKNAFNASEVVENLYRSLLGRAASQAEIDQKVSFIKQNGLGRTVEQFLKSQEFELRLESNSKEENYNFNDKGPIVFVHCWKAGGSTLHHLIGGEFKQNDVFWGDADELFRKNIHKIRSYSLISGHFLLSDTQWIPDKKRVISMLRDPYSRMLSLYHFAKAHDINNVHKNDLQMVKVAKKYSIEEFFNSDEILSNSSLINNYTRTFSLQRDSEKNEISLETAIENIKSLTSFGIMERYEESVNLIFRSLDLPIPQTITKANVLDERIQKRELQQIKKSHLSDKLVDLLHRFVDLDVPFYKEASRIFNERCSQRDKY